MNKRILYLCSIIILSFCVCDAQTEAIPDHLNISRKIVSAGVYGFATPICSLSTTEHNIEGKVVYIPEYNNSTTLAFYIKETLDSLVQEINQMIDEFQKESEKSEYHRKNFSITVEGYPEPFWVNSSDLGNRGFNIFHKIWDEEDEEEYIMILIPLSVCLSTKYNSYKNHKKHFRKQLQKGNYYGIRLQLGFDEKIYIQFSFPLEETIKKMETLNHK